MRVRLMEERGFESALLGLGLSFSKTSDDDYVSGEVMASLHNRAERLAPMNKGHNKFLRQMQLWIDIDAPLYWWKQFDQYKVATVTQSESTMHTLMKRELEQGDFEGGIEAYFLADINYHIVIKDFAWVNRHLPQSFLQRRVCSMSYATFREMHEQRRGHKLSEWDFFIDEMLRSIKHPEFI